MPSEPISLTTGLASLDRLLGGGIPARQVLLIAGQPGSGKTILASQIAFHQAARGTPVLLATAASEPHTKMLESLQGFSFFERDRVGREMFLLSVYPWLRKGVKEAREMLLSSVRERKARLLVVDGLRSLRDVWQDETSIREFLAEMGVGLATSDCTGVFTFECPPSRILETSEAATVDGVVNLFFEREAMRRTRSVEVVKVRGRRHVAGEHPAQVDRGGFTIHPRLESESFPERPAGRSDRAAFGIPALDDFLGGGLPGGGVTLLSGEGGAGKSLLAFAFARSVALQKRPSLFVSLEEPAEALRLRARAVGLSDEGLPLEVVSADPVATDPDALARLVLERARGVDARRVVVDGADLLVDEVHPARRRAFIHALHRALRAGDRDVLWTAEQGGASLGELSRSADNVLEVRARALAVHKTRALRTPRGTWAFEVTEAGWRTVAP